MNRQPTAPKGPPDLTAPDEELNVVVFDFGQHLTPEQRKAPLYRLPGARPLSEVLTEIRRHRPDAIPPSLAGFLDPAQSVPTPDPA